ncbi:MAG TPA: winged helix-turn-helix domain-containing protein [Solirubrobacteraceae bacterium]|nr:winged helix-turn-helix domain-containing protein [Solirubrobacteraceae bacterium]
MPTLVPAVADAQPQADGRPARIVDQQHRHQQQTEGHRAQTFSNLELRPDEMQALVGGARVGLTVREFQVLAALAAREDRVMRRAEIYRQVWGGEMKHRDRAVDVFVRKVRTKLAEAAPTWVYIHTHFGIGYRFAPERGGDGAGGDGADMDGAGVDGADVDRTGVDRTDVDRAGVERAGVERAGVDRANVDRADMDRTDVDRADMDRTGVDGATVAPQA